MSIIVIRDGAATRLDTRPFALESDMQQQLGDHPEILPLHEISDDTAIVAVVRELTVSSGPIDLLAFDNAGGVYVIETKLARNADRRRIVTQALDYGAALWDDFSDREEFFAAVDRRRQATAASPLLDALREAHGGDEGAAAATRENIWQNIAKGEFRFILPMDRVDDSLKALVRFVNENSRFTIYPVELEQYQHDGLTVVVPRIFGAEARKQVGSRGTRGRPSSAEEFLEDVHRRESAGELTGADVAALRTMITLVTEQDAEHNWYVGAPGRVSVSPRFPTTGAVNRAPFTLRSDGNLCLNAESARGIAAWRDWLAQVAKLVGRGHDTRQFLELKPGEWVSKCEQIVALTKPVLAAHLEVAE